MDDSKSNHPIKDEFKGENQILTTNILDESRSNEDEFKGEILSPKYSLTTKNHPVVDDSL